MEIVIKIPDEVLESRHYCQYFGAWSTKLTETIENGTPYNPSGDCISREALKEQVKNEVCEVCFDSPDERQCSPNCKLCTFKQLIDNAQAIEYSLLPLSGEADKAYMRGYEVGKAEGILKAETRPSEQIAWEQGYEAGLAQGKNDRPKGEWIDKGHGRYECSVCGHFPATQSGFPWLSSFCPNCGADMRGGAE